jgi:hypothetical protein
VHVPCPWSCFTDDTSNRPPAVVCGLNAFVAADNSCACNPNNVPMGDGVNCCRPNSAVVNGACACKAGYTWVDPACGKGAEALPFGFGTLLMCQHEIVFALHVCAAVTRATHFNFHFLHPTQVPNPFLLHSTVIVCTAANCATCAANSATTCAACSNGYTLSNGVCSLSE